MICLKCVAYLFLAFASRPVKPGNYRGNKIKKARDIGSSAFSKKYGGDTRDSPVGSNLNKMALFH
ncbi:MAG: hypothetical protein APF84_06750 [Gracilibacter sp. BRH_c7a]|nr:MAG: hypothetical protein APF84_06750 [Gracilibacter sp. BRH_c7a]